MSVMATTSVSIWLSRTTLEFDEPRVLGGMSVVVAHRVRLLVGFEGWPAEAGLGGRCSTTQGCRPEFARGALELEFDLDSLASVPGVGARRTG
jgi:hypothetical protein